MNFLPLCTAIVCPTISGVMSDRRDQVLMTLRSKRRFMSSIFFIRWASTKGPFFSERLIQQTSLPLVAAADDILVSPRVVARLVSLCRRAPWSHRVPPAGRLAFAAAVRMIDRVHRDTAVDRLSPHPPLAAGLANGDVLVLQVSHLADGRAAFQVNLPDFTRRQLDLDVGAFLGQHLGGSASAAHEPVSYTHLRAHETPEH